MRADWMDILIMHPARGPKGQGVADRQRRIALVFFGKLDAVLTHQAH